MAIVLHLDTSGATATVLVAKDGAVIAGRELADQREQSALLNTTISTVMAEAGLDFPALDAVAVCNGPGSYTGLRIALATAKGLCYVWDKPLLLQNRLLLLAGSNCREDGTTVAVLTARQGEYFAAGVDATGNEVLAPAHYITDDLLLRLKNIKGNVTLVGPDAPALVTERSENYHFVPNEIISAAVRTAMAENQLNKLEYADLRLSEPFYLKAAYTTAPAANK